MLRFQDGHQMCLHQVHYFVNACAWRNLKKLRVEFTTQLLRANDVNMYACPPVSSDTCVLVKLLIQANL